MLWLLFCLSVHAQPIATPSDIAAAATDLPFGIIEFVANSEAEPGDPPFYSIYFLKEENSLPGQKLIIAGIRRASQPNIDTPVAADVRALKPGEIETVSDILKKVFELANNVIKLRAGDPLCGLNVNKISEFRVRTFPDQRNLGRNCPRGKISAEAEQLVNLIATVVNDKSRPTLRDLKSHK